MKRKFRDLRDDTKMRISQSLKGRSFSDSHKQAISDAMRQYRATIPHYQRKLTMDRIILHRLLAN